MTSLQSIFVLPKGNSFVSALVAVTPCVDGASEQREAQKHNGKNSTIFLGNLLPRAACELSYLWYESQASLFITVKLPYMYSAKTETKHCLYIYLVTFSGKSEETSAANC